MQAGGYGLRHGKVLVLFPEGERSIDGTVKVFKKGAAILSYHLAAPIVPVALDGVFEIWARNRPINWAAVRPWRRARVAVHFGAPVHGVPAEAGAVRTDATPDGTYEALTAELRSRVERLWLAAHERAGGLRLIRLARVGAAPARSVRPGRTGHGARFTAHGFGPWAWALTASPAQSGSALGEFLESGRERGLGRGRGWPRSLRPRHTWRTWRPRYGDRARRSG